MLTTATPLSDVMAGRAVVPGDSDWDAARQAFNLLVDQHPEAVAFPTDERDVVAVVDYAREHGLRIAPQSTGHNAGPLGSLDGTLLAHTSQLTGVSIDAAARQVRVGALRSGRASRRSSPSSAWPGSTAPLPTSASPATRSAAAWAGSPASTACRRNSVTAIELVTADGHLVRTDPVHEPDLFWALRGGGGNFGVVTAIEFAVYPVEELYAGAMFFPFERASDVLHAWRELLPGAAGGAHDLGEPVAVPRPARGS